MDLSIDLDRLTAGLDFFTIVSQAPFRRSAPFRSRDIGALLGLVVTAMAGCGGSDGPSEPVTVGITLKGPGVQFYLDELQAAMRARGIRVMSSRCHLALEEGQLGRANHFSDVLFIYEIDQGDLESALAAGLRADFKSELFEPSPESCSWVFPVIWTE